MNPRVKIEISDDYIAILHHDEEVVGWHQDEWNEDPSIVPSIANAVLLASTNIRLLRETVGKPFIVPEGKKLRQPENWDEMSMKEKSKFIQNFTTGVCNCTPSIGESCSDYKDMFIDY